MLCHIASHCCGESGLISIQPPDLSGSLQRDLDRNHHEKLGERLELKISHTRLVRIRHWVIRREIYQQNLDSIRRVALADEFKTRELKYWNYSVAFTVSRRCQVRGLIKPCGLDFKILDIGKLNYNVMHLLYITITSFSAATLNLEVWCIDKWLVKFFRSLI